MPEALPLLRPISSLTALVRLSPSILSCFPSPHIAGYSQNGEKIYIDRPHAEVVHLQKPPGRHGSLSHPLAVLVQLTAMQQSTRWHETEEQTNRGILATTLQFDATAAAQVGVIYSTPSVAATRIADVRAANPKLGECILDIVRLSAARTRPSYKLGEVTFHGVEPGARCRREVEDEALMPVEPGSHLGMLMARVVVEDDVNDFSGRNLGFDGVEESG